MQVNSNITPFSYELVPCGSEYPLIGCGTTHISIGTSPSVERREMYFEIDFEVNINLSFILVSNFVSKLSCFFTEIISNVFALCSLLLNSIF